MIVCKLLYRVLEAGTHWWATYYKHHKEKLLIVTSTYDLCLLVTTIKDMFRIVGMQTDDTLIVRIENFLTLKEDKLQKTKFTAKLKE